MAFIKQGGQSKGIELFLDDDFEQRIIELFYIAAENNGFGLNINYLVVKDYASAYHFYDHFYLFSYLKRLIPS